MKWAMAVEQIGALNDGLQRNGTNEPFPLPNLKFIPGCEPPGPTHPQAPRARVRILAEAESATRRPSKLTSMQRRVKMPKSLIRCRELTQGPRSFFDMLEHRKGNLTSKQKGHSSRWPAVFGCHCQLSYLLRQPAASRGVKYLKDK